MKISIPLASAIFVAATAASAQEPVTISVNANGSCMPWVLLDAFTGETFGDSCVGYAPDRRTVRGSCEFSAPPGARYQFRWGGQDGYAVNIGEDGSISYRTAPYFDGLQPNANTVTFNTTTVELSRGKFPGRFGVEFDDVACPEDPDPKKREKRLKIIQGAHFLVTGSYTRPDGTVVNQSNLFRVNADGELQKAVRAAPGAALGYTSDAFIAEREPNGVAVNRGYWRW